MLKGEFPPIRSFAAEYLAFVSATGDGGVEVTYADENIWLSQKRSPFFMASRSLPKEDVFYDRT